MFRVLTGSEFQAAGPAAANELSAKRVLVGRTTKLPRLLVIEDGCHCSDCNIGHVGAVP